MPEDGLVASRMNKGPGGKQPFMRNVIGANGAKAVRRERGLLRPGMKLPDMITVLSAQPDFLAQKTLAEELGEKRGHIVSFLPKYHCELNFIEMVWCKAKQKTREMCNYTFTGLQQHVPIALDSISVSQCRLWARKSRDYCAAYLEGIHSYQAKEQLKIYKSHRRVYLPAEQPPNQ